jgi:hypothetical protein
LIGALIIAIWPNFIYHSVRLMDYSLEASLYAGAILLWLKSIEPRKSPFAILAGALLGLLFFVRYQTGLDWLALLLLSVFCQRPRVKWTGPAFLSLGYGISILSISIHELKHGPFLSSFLNYVRYNFIEGGAVRDYGQQPWHRYLGELAKTYGFIGFLILLTLLAHSLKNLKSNSRNISILFLLPILIYSFMGHKEGRFIIGFSWLLVPVALAEIEKFKRFNLAFLFAGVVALGIDAHRTHLDWSLHAQDVAQFAQISDALKEKSPSLLAIHQDPDFSPGSFFLRPKMPICYQYEAKVRRGECPTTLPSGTLHMQYTQGAWMLNPEPSN